MTPKLLPKDFTMPIKNSIKHKICILVNNNFDCDPRVKKQANSAAAAGYETLVLGWETYLGYGPLMEEKNQDGFTVNVGKFLFVGSSLIEWLNCHLFFFNFGRLWNSFCIRIQPSIPWLFRATAMLKELIGQIRVRLNPDRKPSKIKDFFERSRYNLLWYKKLYRFMISLGVKFKPDIVHANDLDTLLAGYLIKKKTGAKLLYDAHEIWTKQGLTISKILIFLFSIIERLLINEIDAFVSVNESIIEEISLMYGLRADIPKLAIYNAPKYQSIRFSSNDFGKYKVIYQGRYAPDRGLEEIVLASNFLPGSVTTYFRAIGDEEVKKRIFDKIKINNLQKKVKILPSVGMGEMVNSARDFDIGLIDITS